jgi:hypothetical protein
VCVRVCAGLFLCACMCLCHGAVMWWALFCSFLYPTASLFSSFLFFLSTPSESGVAGGGVGPLAAVFVVAALFACTVVCKQSTARMCEFVH